MTIKTFKSLFGYDKSKTGFIGVERECFITAWISNNKVVPRAHEVLSSIGPRGIPYVQAAGNYWSGEEETRTTWHRVKDDEFGYELSACQIESRIGPCRIGKLQTELKVVDRHLEMLLSSRNLNPLYCEVGPVDMPLDVYPNERYQKITKGMPREILLAACRVIGTHVHIGMRDHDMALRVYNYVIQHLVELCEMGNGSFGERLAIYKQMAPDYEPKPYASWEEYYQVALAKGFAEDPRKCWTLIRISVHGTIEFRMFGATDSIDRIVGWATRCHELCQKAMNQT